MVDGMSLLEQDSLALSTLKCHYAKGLSSKNWRLQTLIAPLRLLPQGKSALQLNSD